jgi:protein-S-isoprenylcysteine O-methyltransferase Ste14
MENNDQNHPLKNTVHRVLAHSYYVYFLLFLVGIGLDFFLRIKIFNNPWIGYFGFFFLVLATFLIFWAQYTSHTLNKDNITKETFCRGPYCYTRSPTHLGLFLLMLGFGMVTNALFVVLFSIIAFILTKVTFLNKQEKILEERYGAPYSEYKKSVKL